MKCHLEILVKLSSEERLSSSFNRAKSHFKLLRKTTWVQVVFKSKSRTSQYWILKQYQQNTATDLLQEIQRSVCISKWSHALFYTNLYQCYRSTNYASKNAYLPYSNFSSSKIHCLQCLKILGSFWRVVSAIACPYFFPYFLLLKI